MTTQPAAVPHRATPRTGPLLAALAAMAAAWSAGWWGAAHFAGQQLDEWLAHEAADGRQWSCPDRDVIGFPFALTLHCARPSFRGEVAGHPADGSVEGLDATVGVLHPATLAVALRGPLVLRARDDAFLVSLTWSALDLALPLGPGGPTGGTGQATRLAVAGSAPGRGDLNLRAAGLSGSVAVPDGAPADRRFAFALTGLTFPTLELPPSLGDGDMQAAGSGVLTEATRLAAPSVANLEAWRRTGGALRLEALRFGKGSFGGVASGSLGLDEAHRPAGTLDLALTGFEPLARQLGIPVAGVQLGGLLASVLGGHSAAPPAGGGALQLPLTLADGLVRLGPIPLGATLAPLY